MSNVEQDNYQSWMERVAGGRTARPLAEGETVQSSGGTPVEPIEFVRMPRKKYLGEVGRKKDDLVFHFFPLGDGQFPDDFEGKMAEAFLEVFKLEDRVEASYVPELHSWAARARGFAHTTGNDKLVLQLFALLDQKLD